LLELGTDFPGVARASERRVWTSLSPDPNLLLGIPAERFPPQETSAAETLRARKSMLGKNLSVSYQRPLKIVRGWQQYLYDDTGRAYLDVYNNVPLVGHSHPRVVRAAQEQLALLNTNTRYLHENAIRYAQRLTQLLPEPLRVCYFLNSGSEANELALRLARAHTGREDIIVLEANLDDMNPQVYGYFAERALEAGALDVFSIPVQMKKNRPGQLITVLCKPADREKLSDLLFRETTTLGVRQSNVKRRTLQRESVTVETSLGSIRMKIARLNGQILNVAPEYEDCRKVAAERGVPLRQVLAEATFQFQKLNGDME